MSEPFPVSGNIEPTSFPHLLADLHRHGATGSLKVTGPTHPKALYFRNGRILFGSSNDPRDQLGAILVESGKITREQLEQVTAKVGPGNPLAKVLSESGFVNQRELGDAARAKVERILADLLSWDSGSFEFEDGVLPKGAVDLKLSTEKLLLSAVQRIPDRSFALRHVGLGSVLEPVAEGEPALSEIRAEVWPLLERLDGRRTLKDAIALTRLDEFDAAKTACALLFLGVVRPKAEPAAELDLAQEAQSGFEAEATVEPEARPEPELFAVPLSESAEPPFGVTSGPELPLIVDAEPEASEAAPPALSETPATPPTPDRSLLPAPPEPPAQVPPRPAAPAEPAPALPPDASTFVLPQSPVAPTRQLVPEPQPPSPPAEARSWPGPPTAAPPAPEPTILLTPRRPAAPSEDERGPEAPAREAGRRESAAAASGSRPTQEDLAALDALLNPSASTGRMARPIEDTPPAGKWEPQFRPPTTVRRSARVRPRSSAPLPLLLTALVAIVLTSVAAWYYFLRATPASQSPAAAPVAQRRPAPAPPGASAATAPLPATASRPAPAPTATGTAAQTAAAARPATPTAPPTRTATAPASTAAPRDAAAAANGPALLMSGSLPEAARAFAASLAAGPRNRYSLQLLTACSPQTVQKAVAAAGTGELFILPVQLQGRACYRVCWGVYATREQAEAATAAVPAYFRQGGARARLSPVAEILP